MRLFQRTIHDLHQMLVDREISSAELTESVLAQIEAVGEKTRAYLLVTRDLALRQAKAADERLKRKRDVAPLTGIPIALKDVLCVKDVTSTAGSKILKGFLPPYSATVVERLEADGAVFLGKTNCDEFAMGSSNENSGYWPVHNPWALDRVPGGSSGGSAAAVASGEAIAALGSDTGGSIRQPAALTGIVGMKPTYGRVSRYGLIAFASSLDQIGPMTRDVVDCAVLLQAVAGHDRRDSTSSQRPVPDYLATLRNGVKGMKLGVPKEYFVAGMEPAVEQSIRDAIGLFEQQGASIEEVSLPHSDVALPAYYIIAPAEASSNLARYDGTRYGFQAGSGRNLIDEYMQTREEGFGAEVKRRIMLGTYALSAGYYDAYYLQAQKVRTLIIEDFKRAFTRVDALLGATSPTVAFPLGAKTQDPVAMYLNDIITIPANLGNVCGVSVPCGLVDGLPIGLQIIAPGFREEVALRVAYAFEAATEFHKAQSPLLGAAA
ncbi:MAG: Asp-tRNA(Asn)/Glu-tRNA(Gln) amidotransferase subunit GatA [Chloroflexi bacterium]|nr:MAG: Asp-tRNA(Asn)/Glu-tRNA(Gln) amidotransferase subunit GatA [Chloroflexota bacterium]TME45834.1 MAG: Asp-tRNA(Asn)/Glu-tRNA(Gln) amidotransferase subunit GatA [Chloroflexota bacterium]